MSSASMRLTKLPHIWWRRSYMSEHKELLAFVKYCVANGQSWESTLWYNFKGCPEKLHPGLNRLCTELGPRLFEAYPSFKPGDGATIVSPTGGIAATVHSVDKSVVSVQRDSAYGSRTGDRVLYLPRTDAVLFTFTFRTTKEWLLLGNNAPTLIYGRHVSC